MDPETAKLLKWRSQLQAERELQRWIPDGDQAGWVASHDRANALESRVEATPAPSPAGWAVKASQAIYSVERTGIEMPDVVRQLRALEHELLAAGAEPGEDEDQLIRSAYVWAVGLGLDPDGVIGKSEFQALWDAEAARRAKVDPSTSGCVR